MEARKLAGCEAYPIHGLRKNATIELLERGCTDAEAMAITGHSTRAMLLKYGAKVGQKKLAESAAVKRWTKTETERETAKLFAKPKNGEKS